MKIIVPEPKRAVNLAKHGIDLADFEAGFGWDRYLAFPTRPSRTGRTRYLLVGTLHGSRVVTAIVAPLGTEALTVISLRDASDKERTAYEA